ncbi:MAG: nickel-responsive transcriptional regulator NikR [Marinilabiliaceae bacterium]
MSVTRFGVSLERELLDELDHYVGENLLANRSQGIRRLINNYLVERKWQCNNVVAGAISLVYDHHKHDLLMKLANIQHEYHNVILSSQHFHLDDDNCFEVIAVRGKSRVLTELADKLRAVKGVSHGKLSMTTTG